MPVPMGGSGPELKEGGEPLEDGTPAGRQAIPTRKPITIPQFLPFSVESSPGSKQDSRLKVRLLRLQMEKEEKERDFELHRELELRKLEADTAFKMRQLELQTTADAARPVPAADKISPQSAGDYDVSKYISLVPVFREAEVETYFGAFERVAGALRWPKEVWAILLQCKLTGKAQEACAALSVEDGLNYDRVKNAILRAYELVPEAYRQRFRGLRKSPDQTFTDFAREKGVLFDRWCASCKADDVAAIRELILLEEFKNSLPERTAVYLGEQKIASLQQAAIFADEFALLHKSTFTKHEVSSRGGFESTEQLVRSPIDSRPKGSPIQKADRVCFFCRKVGHLIADCRAWKGQQPKVDASATGAGAVLMQRGDGDMCKPVCYFSTKFKKHQLNYSTIEKETLAMLLALQYFEVYVGSSFLPVTVYTDHNPLVFLARMYNSNQRLMRWALLAQGYNLHIKHKRGADNIVADALSREYPCPEPDVMGNPAAGTDPRKLGRRIKGASEALSRSLTHFLGGPHPSGVNYCMNYCVSSYVDNCVNYCVNYCMNYCVSSYVDNCVNYCVSCCVSLWCGQRRDVIRQVLGLQSTSHRASGYLGEAAGSRRGERPAVGFSRACFNAVESRGDCLLCCIPHF
ncbi:retrotransposable element [Pimephales promelas]|nr:retrotransposable element [Pimephales promelas]